MPVERKENKLFPEQTERTKVTGHADSTDHGRSRGSLHFTRIGSYVFCMIIVYLFWETRSHASASDPLYLGAVVFGLSFIAVMLISAAQATRLLRSMDGQEETRERLQIFQMGSDGGERPNIKWLEVAFLMLAVSNTSILFSIVLKYLSQRSSGVFLPFLVAYLVVPIVCFGPYFCYASGRNRATVAASKRRLIFSVFLALLGTALVAVGTWKLLIAP